MTKTCAEYIADGAEAPVSRWGWKNKALPAIHMPRDLCRLELQIHTVRIERLQSISEADAIAEGLREDTADGMPLWHGGHDGGSLWRENPWEAYRDLWGSINGPESWEADPFVWVLGFHVAARFLRGAERERPILFSASMVRALLSGRKTQTRRIVKPQPEVDEYGLLRLEGAAGFTAQHCLPNPSAPCRYGDPGDRLWVREGVRRVMP